MWKISFELGSERSLNSISFRLDRMVGTMESWSSTVFGLNQPNEEWEIIQNFGDRKIWSLILLKFNKSMNYYKNSVSGISNRTWNSLIENFWFRFPKFCHYPKAINLTRSPKPRANFLKSNRDKGMPKACLSGNQWSLYLQHLAQNFWAPSLIISKKKQTRNPIQTHPRNQFSWRTPCDRGNFLWHQTKLQTFLRFITHYFPPHFHSSLVHPKWLILFDPFSDHRIMWAFQQLSWHSAATVSYTHLTLPTIYSV